MTTQASAAYGAVKKVIKENNRTNKSGETLLRKAKNHASRKLKGAGNAKPISLAAAKYLANHPASKNAQKIVKAM